MSYTEDICNFIPPKKVGGLEYYHFVYETRLKRLKQPFKYGIFHAYLCVKGDGVLEVNGCKYPLTSGTLFFAFPEEQYTLTDVSGLTYLYISFGGCDASSVLADFGVSRETRLFEGFSHLVHFWMSSIRRVDKQNAVALTESVLLYTLSYINSDKRDKGGDRFNSVLEYIDANITEPTLSISKVSDIFFYSEKYLSALFTRRMGERFTSYVNIKRIENAKRYLVEDKLSVSDISYECGFSDPFYFSKVFKKYTGMTPSQFSKKNSERNGIK